MIGVLLATFLTAAPTAKVASPPWNVVDIKPELASFYAEQMAQALRAEGLKVTTADDIATLLGTERQRELLGCSSGNSCMAELANALGCDATLTVNLARLGGGFRGLAKVMSSRDGSILSSVKIDATTEAQLSDRIEAAAKELARPFKAELVPVVETKTIPEVSKAIPEVTKPAGPVKVAPKFWWIPGAVGAVSLAVGVAFIGLAAGKYDDLVNKPAPITSLLGSNWATEGKNLQTAGWLFSGAGLAAIAASILWLALGSTEVAPQVSVSPEGASLGLRGQF